MADSRHMGPTSPRASASPSSGVVRGPGYTLGWAGAQRSVLESDLVPRASLRDHAGVPHVSALGPLVQFQSGDGTVLRPDDGAKYTLEFGADGSLIARVDCNRGRGTWTSPGPSQLTLGPLALTRALCPPGSLHDRLVRDLGFVRTYVMQGGHLFLSLFPDAGTYELEPIP